MTLLKQIEQAVGKKKATRIINLINGLFWEADRMSEAGNKTLNMLADMLETEV